MIRYPTPYHSTDLPQFPHLSLLRSLLLRLLRKDRRVGVQAQHDLLVLERVLLLHRRPPCEGTALGSVEDVLHLGAVDETREIGLRDEVAGQEEVLLVHRRLGRRSVNVIESLERSRGPDDEASEVTTRGELEQVQGRDGARLDTRQVAETLDHQLAVQDGVVDDKGTTSLLETATTHLSLTRTHLPRLLDPVDIGGRAAGLEHGLGAGSLGEDGGLAQLGIDNERDFGDGHDLVATGHEEGDRGGGSEGGADGISPSGVSLETRDAQTSHFWPWLILMCHFLQILVGANMRPERHMLPKAA